MSRILNNSKNKNMYPKMINTINYNIHNIYYNNTTILRRLWCSNTDGSNIYHQQQQRRHQQCRSFYNMSSSSSSFNTRKRRIQQLSTTTTTSELQQAQRLFLCVDHSDDSGTNTGNSSTPNDSNNGSITFNNEIHNNSSNIDSQAIVSILQQNIILPPEVIQQYPSMILSSNEVSMSSSSLSSSTKVQMVQSVDDIVHAINQHYSIFNEGQFVGGMGEQDLGVYFIPNIRKRITSNTNSNNNNNNDNNAQYEYIDVLQCNDTIQVIQDGIATVKEIRHGIPFGCYTNGILSIQNSIIPLNEIGMDIYEVSLFGSTPTQYTTARCMNTNNNNNNKDFQMVCSFIVTAIEEYNVNVEVSVLQQNPFMNDTRTLATSLGAQNIHVYNST